MKANFDIEKFICSLVKQNSSKIHAIKKALDEQGLEVDKDIMQLIRAANAPLTMDDKKKEDRFNVGDWIVYNGDPNRSDSVMRIQAVRDKTYLCLHADGQTSYDKEGVETTYHLWNIKDAKTGDVLVASDNSVFLFNGLDRGGARYFTAISDKGNLHIGNGLSSWETGSSSHPANIRQRDFLFQKMHEEGYEWDADKMELKKIEHKPVELLKGEDYGIDGFYHAIEILKKTLGKVEGYQSDDGILEHEIAIDTIKALDERSRKGWTEDDLHIKGAIIEHLVDSNLIEWANWLNNSVLLGNGKPTKWSKEDERILNGVIAILEAWDRSHTANGGIHSIVPNYISWLDNLKYRCDPQANWKPTEEQIDALRYVIPNFIKFDNEDLKVEEGLNSLYDDLMKLQKQN